LTTAEQKRKEGGFAETVRVVIHALLIAVVIRTFLFQPFNIPSGSMMATLLIGDYLFVSKYTYGYSRYSFPFSLPLFTGRVFGSGPERGDVVVFRLPRDDSTDYIKRVIGLPGDRIQMIDGVLNINGVAIKRERAEDYVGTEDGPFIIYRRRRFVSWLSDQFFANRPYDEIVRELIADDLASRSSSRESAGHGKPLGLSRTIARSAWPPRAAQIRRAGDGLPGRR